MCHLGLPWHLIDCFACVIWQHEWMSSINTDMRAHDVPWCDWWLPEPAACVQLLMAGRRRWAEWSQDSEHGTTHLLWELHTTNIQYTAINTTLQWHISDRNIQQLRWCNGAIHRISDLWLTGRRFESPPCSGLGQATYTCVYALWWPRAWHKVTAGLYQQTGISSEPNACYRVWD